MPNFFFFCFPVSSVACVLSLLHRTAEMSRSVVAVARLLGRSRLAAPTCSVPSLNFGIGGIVVDDGSVLCERHTIMNGGGALSGGQAAWGSIHQVPSRAFSDDHTAKWMQVFSFFLFLFFFPFFFPPPGSLPLPGDSPFWRFGYIEQGGIMLAASIRFCCKWMYQAESPTRKQ